MDEPQTDPRDAPEADVAALRSRARRGTRPGNSRAADHFPEVSALADSELLALFLPSIPRRRALELAHAALAETGGLRPLLTLSRERLCAFPGFGPAQHDALQASLELGRRHITGSLDRGRPLESVAQIGLFFTAKLRDRPHEIFSALFFDSHHRVIAYEELFTGTIDRTTVHIREVVRCALNHNATAVVFAHNHPSGAAEPTEADQLLTCEIIAAFAFVEVLVLDHLVIGDGHYVSFSDRGLL